MYKKFIRDIWSHGGEAYLVGGWVRDKLMGIPEDDIKDVDLEVLGLKREEFEKIIRRYGKFKRVGKAYEIYILNNNLEISFIEGRVSLEECSKRRDFTINSIYYNILEDRYEDFFGGIGDIKNKILKYINIESFMEDPLRILRTAQFMSRFGFSVEASLEKLIKERGEDILDIPRERICHELEKIYLLGKKPSEGFYFLEKTGVLKNIMPEITDLKEIIQDKTYHPEGDVFTHTMMMLDILPKEERTAELFWGIIYHDAGKKETYPTFEGHCEKSEEIFQREIVKFTNNRDIIGKVRKLIRYHEEPLKIMLKGECKRVSVKKLAVRVDIEKLLQLYRCDVLGRGRSENTEELKNIEDMKGLYNEIKDNLQPIVKGKELMKWGIEPDKTYGEILENLYEAQLDEKFQSIEEAKNFFFDYLSAGRVYKGI
jgi:tRNA nucleotidyltransferase (CCA-adding enzyme)